MLKTCLDSGGQLPSDYVGTAMGLDTCSVALNDTVVMIDCDSNMHAWPPALCCLYRVTALSARVVISQHVRQSRKIYRYHPTGVSACFDAHTLLT